MENQPPAEAGTLRWLLYGARGIFSIPAFILMGSFVGFGILCRESGLTVGQSMMMTGTIWAMPSQVVLVGAISSGAPLVVAALAVALSAVRLTPMTASWVPLVRSRQTSRYKLLALSHFIAVTSWVWSAMRMPSVPPEVRLTYYAGFSVTLMLVNLSITCASFLLASAMPPLVGGALFFLTPIYFITALTAASRHLAERLAMPIGIILGPLFFHLQIGLDLVWAGLLGGTIAYLADWIYRKRSPRQHA